MFRKSFLALAFTVSGVTNAMAAGENVSVVAIPADVTAMRSDGSGFCHDSLAIPEACQALDNAFAGNVVKRLND